MNPGRRGRRYRPWHRAMARPPPRWIPCRQARIAAPRSARRCGLLYRWPMPRNPKCFQGLRRTMSAGEPDEFAFSSYLLEQLYCRCAANVKIHRRYAALSRQSALNVFMIGTKDRKASFTRVVIGKILRHVRVNNYYVCTLCVFFSYFPFTLLLKLFSFNMPGSFGVIPLCLRCISGVDETYFVSSFCVNDN